MSLRDADPTMVRPRESDVELIDGIDPVYGEPREQVRPREEVAKAIYAHIPTWQIVKRPTTTITPRYEHVRVDDTWEEAADRHEECRAFADAVLNRLRELGAFNDQFYDAIKKEAGK